MHSADDLRQRALAGPFASYPSLRRRRVLITGGASGIGAALVRGFVQQGASVAFLDVQDTAAAALISELAATQPPNPHAPIYRHCDLADADAIPAAVADCIRSLGGADETGSPTATSSPTAAGSPAATSGAAAIGTLDVLINNAGNDRRHSTGSLAPAEWDQLLAINLRQQFFVTQAALPALRRSGSASILHMSSIAWRIPSTGLPAYVASKAAIVGLARSLAFEEGINGIRVNSIQPGAILTEKQKQLWITPEYSAEILARQAIKRHLEPEEVVRLALFLAAQDSSAITGQSYVIDGGWV